MRRSHRGNSVSEWRNLPADPQIHRESPETAENEDKNSDEIWGSRETGRSGVRQRKQFVISRFQSVSSGKGSDKRKTDSRRILPSVQRGSVCAPQLQKVPDPDEPERSQPGAASRFDDSGITDQALLYRAASHFLQIFLRCWLAFGIRTLRFSSRFRVLFSAWFRASKSLFTMNFLS